MADAFPVWLHVVAATVWVGPQFFAFLVSVPALRTVDDARQRLRATRLFAARFNYLVWASMAILVLTGISMLIHERNEHSPASLMDLRWGAIFIAKMAAVAITILLTAFHTFWSGPRTLDMQERALESGTDPPALASMHRASVVASSLALLSSGAVLFLAALLVTPDFSLQPR